MSEIRHHNGNSFVLVVLIRLEVRKRWLLCRELHAIDSNKCPVFVIRFVCIVSHIYFCKLTQ